MSYYANYGYIIANASGSNCPEGTSPGPKGPSGNRYCLDVTEMNNATGVVTGSSDIPSPSGSYDFNANLQPQGVDVSGSPANVGQSLLTGLLNVFAPKTPAAVSAPSIPTWVYVAVPLGLVGVFLMVKGRQPARAVAGYKRRKSRRSRR